MENVYIEGVRKQVIERLIVSEMSDVIVGWRKGRNVVSKICIIHLLLSGWRMCNAYTVSVTTVKTSKPHAIEQIILTIHFEEMDCEATERVNPLNPELNPICYLLALLGAHHFLHVSRIRVKSLTLRRLMSYIYGAPILDVSRSHTTTQHSR